MIALPDAVTRERAAYAYQQGERRTHHARRNGQAHRHAWEPTTDESALTDAQAAVAEMFVAAIHCLEWTREHATTPDKDGTDVGGFVSVRWTPLPHGALIVHEDEPNDIVGALVTGPYPDMVYRGAIDIQRAKNPNWWRDNVRNPAYFVPQHALK